MSSLLAGLNPQQREAVEHTEGPLLILAGAGSGKTRVITHRIAHLIAHHGVPASGILAMTFTNKAAQEMAERVRSLLPTGFRERPVISTFHSFCVRSLRRDYEAIGGRRDFVIYADDEQMALVKSLCRQMGLDDKQFPPRTVLSRISGAKNKGLDAEAYVKSAADPRSERVGLVFAKYQQELRKANALDFDDLLLEMERLLQRSLETRARYSEAYPFLLIDEYQDTNRPQYELMRLLSSKSQNVCVVGDEDQSIYSWRGADIRNILDFEQDYRNARIIRLEQNYRSTRNILDAATAVVSNNTERKGKVLWTESGAGEKVGYYRAGDGENEALFVAETIRAALKRSPDAHIAVLYRTNAQSRLFEEALRRYNIAYRVLGGFSFYERAEVKDLLAYLRVALNPDDSISLLRIINTPTRGIGKTTVESLEQWAMEKNVSLFAALTALTADGAPAEGSLNSRAIQALRGFRGLLADLIELREAGGSAHDLLKCVLDKTGYARLLEKEETPEAQSRLENLSELLNAAADSAARGESVGEFLDHAALVSDADEFEAASAVSLMTLHTAKGLEFAVVFLVGMEDGLFPHSRALNSLREMEEERRLCYVGMTRARQQLFLSHATYRRRFGGGAAEPQRASRFLQEVSPELLQDLSAPSGPVYVTEGYSQEVKSTTGRQRWNQAVAGARPSHGNHANLVSFFRKETATEPAPARVRGGDSGPEVRMAPVSAVSKPFAAAGSAGLRPGARVRHARYGTGTVLRIEGEGDERKVTVSFPGFGLKKMIERLASLQVV